MAALMMFFFVSCFEPKGLGIVHSDMPEHEKSALLQRVRNHCMNKAAFMARCQAAYMKGVTPNECKLIKI